MNRIISLISWAIFGFGLTVSSMTNPAKVLGFLHPKSGKELEFTSILPEELEKILKSLRKQSK